MEDLNRKNVQKLPRLVKRPKTNKKEVWKSLVRASSSAQPTEEKKEEEDVCILIRMYVFIYMCMYACIYVHVCVYAIMYVCFNVCMYVCALFFQHDPHLSLFSELKYTSKKTFHKYFFQYSQFSLGFRKDSRVSSKAFSNLTYF